MGSSAGGRWFVVLPDHEAASAVFERIRDTGCQVVRHASGRPWLAGCWDDSAARLAEAGDVRLAVLGVSTLDTGQLRARAGAVRATSDVETAVRGSAGDHFLLASVAGRVYARGTASGSRRLYRAEVDGVTVVADRARTLARFTGAAVDLRHVAARLVSLAMPPFPLDQASLFEGVRAVPPGHAVLLERAGGAAERRWWQPPESELALAEGAENLREALRTAVRARVTPGEQWAADLSGGMDSTSLCFLAAEAGAELVTLTLDPGAPGDEDVAYARRAAAGLPAGTPHLVFDATTLPAYYTGLDDGEPEDEPTLGIRDRAQQDYLVGVMHAHGATRRLCGQGGDQLVIPPPSYLHDLVRRQPRLATRQLAAYAAKQRWPRAATVRALADRRPFPVWLAAEAGDLTGGRERAGDVQLGWGLAMSLPHWATDRARESTAGLLREAAAHTEPLADTRGRHLWLFMAQQAARVALLYDRQGFALDMPFCDDAVLEACLRVRPHEATTPWAYKPLLATAMRGIVPQPLLDRTTKGNATPEWHRGMRVHRRTLAAWLEDSRLVATGLAEPRALAHVWMSPGTLPAHEGPPAEATVALESWLRAVERHPVPHYLKEHTHEPAPGS